MAQVVAMAEKVWASLAGRQHALLSAVVLGRSVVDLTLRLYSDSK
jgi:predicted house-cleaning NTP pyrophosphatase (Maf/HAM1 superfamily)